MENKLKEKWYNSPRTRLLMAIVLNLAFLAILLLCFEVRYEENDDLTVQKFLDGQTSEKSAFVIYINYFLALGLKALYSLCGNALPVFSIFQYALLFVSFTGMSYLLFKKLEPLTAALVSLMVLCFIGADSYLIMTYTKTAGVAAAGGISLMLSGLEEKQGLQRQLPLWLGAATAALSFMLRDKEAIACIALMAPLGLYGLVNWLKGEKCGLVRKALSYLVPFVLLFALIAGLFGANEYIWNSSDHYDYKLYNAARSRYGDFGMPKYSELPQAYDAYGIDESALELLNCYDVKKFTAESFNAICDARDENIARPSLGESLGIFLDHCLGSFFKEKHIYALAAVLLLWLAAGKRDWLSASALALAFAAFGLLYLYLIHQTRYLVNRTDVGFFFALTLTVLWMLKPEQLKNEKVLCLFLCALCLFLGYRQNRNYCRFSAESYIMDDSQQKAAVELLIEDEHLFLTEIGSINHTLYSPLETVPAGYGDKLILLGDWMVQHPKVTEKLAEYGIVNPYEDVVDNDKVYLLADDVELSLAYIRNHYAPNARAELAEPLSHQTGLSIYRILSQ